MCSGCSTRNYPICGNQGSKIQDLQVGREKFVLFLPAESEGRSHRPCPGEAWQFSPANHRLGGGQIRAVRSPLSPDRGLRTLPPESIKLSYKKPISRYNCLEGQKPPLSLIPPRKQKTKFIAEVVSPVMCHFIRSPEFSSS